MRHGATHTLAFDDIIDIEVGQLPDQPRKPFRIVGGAEVHGGNFTPSLNRGVKITLRGGKVIWFGLPQPDTFARDLQNLLPAKTVML